MGCVPNKGVSEVTSKSTVINGIESKFYFQELVCIYKAQNKIFRLTITKAEDIRENSDYF